MTISHRRAARAEMAISERELRQLTGDLHDLHESTFTRRGFFLGAAGVVALGAAAACTGAPSGRPAASPATPPPAPQETYPGDLKVVALAAALENLAVTAYEGALKKAALGELGAVPPAVATFVQTVMRQHADHAQAWNAVLSAAGKPTIADAPLSIAQEQVAMLAAAKSVPDVAKLALDLENVAAQTYTFAVANSSDARAIVTAATIQPVEATHATILNYLLGQYPIPDTFIGVSSALKPDMLTVN